MTPQPETEAIDTSRIQERIVNDPNVVAFIGSLKPLRVGVPSFTAFLEYRHYPPRSARSELFEMYKIEWQNLEFIVIVVPAYERHYADTIMRQVGLRAEQGSPTLLERGQDVKHFPIRGANVFTLQHLPGHFAYNQDSAEFRTALLAEQRAIKAEIRKFLGQANS